MREKYIFKNIFYFHKEIHLESVFFHLKTMNIIYKFMLKI